MLDYINSALKCVQLSGIRRFNEEASKEKDCIFLTIGEPDFSTPASIKDEVKRSLDENLTHYPPSNGNFALRRKICEFEKLEYDLNYRPDEVIVTTGATEALFVALGGIINPGDEIIVPIPCYTLYQPVIQFHRGVFVALDTNSGDFQITEDKLLDCITSKTKAIILTSPNNPTGCVYTKETLTMIHDMVKQHKMFVICDDVYCRLCFQSQMFRFCQFSDIKDRIIIVNSFSKPYAMTGWRIGYLMADHKVKQQLEKLHQYMVVSTPSIMQNACVTALDYNIDEMMQAYKRRKDFVYHRLCLLGLDVIEPQGAFYLFPSIKKYGMNSETFCRKMVKEVKLAVLPGLYFGCDDHIRISYCYSDEQLKVALDRFECFINNLSI